MDLKDYANKGIVILNPESISQAWKELRVSRYALGKEFDEEPVLRFMFHEPTKTFKIWIGYEREHVVFSEERLPLRSKERYPLYTGLANVKDKTYACFRSDAFDEEIYNPDLSDTPIDKFFKDYSRLSIKDWNRHYIKNYQKLIERGILSE